MPEPIFFVITVIGDDRPGLVGELAAVVSQHNGNWLESSMANLAGKFAGIVKLAVPASHAEPLRSALNGLVGLTIMVAVSARPSATGGRKLKLSLIGHDRIGIVKEVSQVLARHAVNVEELATHVSSAPMSAEALFHAQAQLTAPADLDRNVLTTELERLSNDLMVDIAMDETIS